MPLFFFDMVGIDEDDIGADFPSADRARNAAVAYLGEYLQDYPGYASQGHWQVNVLDEARRPVFNVVVATIDARQSASQDRRATRAGTSGS